MKKIKFHRFLIPVLITFLFLGTNAQTSSKVQTVFHYRIPEFYSDNEDVKKSVANIKELITEKGTVLSRLQVSEPEKYIYNVWGSEKNIRVLEDRIEFTNKDETTSVSFKHIVNSFGYYSIGGRISGIILGDFSIAVREKEGGQKLKNEFDLLIKKNKNLYYEARTAQLLLFEPTAAEYRALKVKPPVSEEQRKYIVQANAFNEKKMYYEAIRLYEQAIVVDQTAYPTAYSNLALLSAQVKQYDNAIYHMKKYLLLVPDATDARGAQDKIYEWETQIAR
jgi:tetratricopeptide (TPR) repeat protein